MAKIIVTSDEKRKLVLVRQALDAKLHTQKGALRLWFRQNLIYGGPRLAVIAVAYVRNRPVGVAAIYEYPLCGGDGNPGLAVYVLPAHRRRGIGMQLALAVRKRYGYKRLNCYNVGRVRERFFSKVGVTDSSVFLGE